MKKNSKFPPGPPKHIAAWQRRVLVCGHKTDVVVVVRMALSSMFLIADGQIEPTRLDDLRHPEKVRTGALVDASNYAKQHADYAMSLAGFAPVDAASPWVAVEVDMSKLHPSHPGMFRKDGGFDA